MNTSPLSPVQRNPTASVTTAYLYGFRPRLAKPTGRNCFVSRRSPIRSRPEASVGHSPPSSCGLVIHGWFATPARVHLKRASRCRCAGIKPTGPPRFPHDPRRSPVKGDVIHVHLEEVHQSRFPSTLPEIVPHSAYRHQVNTVEGEGGHWERVCFRSRALRITATATVAPPAIMDSTSSPRSE